MVDIVGVRFREVGKIYYFDPKDFEIKAGDKVIVETSRGLEYGNVVLGNRKVEISKVKSPLKSVIRIADEEDTKRVIENRKKEEEALRVCKERILLHELDMKLISAEYTFDSTKLLFYFSSDGRVDFRDLVKDLAGIFKTRIELRQIGVRDETKILGGLGSCGRSLCCNTYLSTFASITIKAAKDQNLSLNPQKISGVCGRLMCCLQNEVETYEELNKNLPEEGERVKTKNGEEGVVVSLSILRQKVKVLIEKEKEEKEIVEYDISELKYKPRKKSYNNEEYIDADVLALEDEKDECIEYDDIKENSINNKKNFKKKYNKNRD